MKYLPLFFLTIKIFYFFNYRVIHKFQENLKRYLDEDDKNAARLMLSGLPPQICIGFLLADILFLAYCVYLMLSPQSKTPGILLLTIDTLETAAVYFRIKWASTIDNQGYTYPSLWLRYLAFGATVFILINLYGKI